MMINDYVEICVTRYDPCLFLVGSLAYDGVRAPQIACSVRSKPLCLFDVLSVPRLALVRICDINLHACSI